MIPIIEEAELRRRVTPAVALAAIRDAFRADGEGRTTVPPVVNLQTHDGEFHIKTAHVAGVPYVAVKIASGFYRNAAIGLPTGSGLMAVFDGTTGMPVALLLDNGYLTDIRTGAAGAVAADCLARQAIETVGVIGTGVQGRLQAICLREVRTFGRIVAWSPVQDELERYCDEMRAALGVEARAAAGPEEVCRAADVLVTATPARQSFVRADWLRPGLHVTALGADTPGKQELDATCLPRADLVVVDRRAQCAAFGELHAAIETGRMTADEVHAELGEVVAGRRPGRTRDDQLTIADLTGVGFQDTAIASAALDVGA